VIGAGLLAVLVAIMIYAFSRPARASADASPQGRSGGPVVGDLNQSGGATKWSGSQTPSSSGSASDGSS
jgi:hypothetical protein